MSEGLTIKARPVRCGEEAQDTKDIWRVRAEVDSGDGKGPRPVVVEFDLKKPQEVCIEGSCQAAGKDDFEALRKLTEKPASAEEREKLCQDPKPQHTLKLTGVVAATGGWALKGGSTDNPLAGNVYQNDGLSPDVEVGVEWKISGVTAVANMVVGPAARAYQPAGLTSEAPLSPLQMYAKYCGGLLCIGGGQFLTAMGDEIAGLQNLFMYRSRSFYFIPYTETGVEGSVGNDTARLTLRVTPEGDRVKDDNAFPYFHANLAFNSEFLSVIVNDQFGPVGEGRTDLWRQTADAGFYFNPSGSTGGSLYGLHGTQMTDAGRIHWGGVNGIFRTRPGDGPIGIAAKVGYTHDGGLIAPVDLVEVGGGIDVIPAEVIRFRLQTDVLVATDDSSPFNGGDALVRLGGQVIFGHSFELGLPTP